MEQWSNEFTLQFLEAYHGEAVLWDPTHEQHKDKRKLNDAWRRLSEQLDRPVTELKRKKDSLMATFRGHLRKKKASIRSGASGEDVYKPVWFAYDYMEEILAPVYGITENDIMENSVKQEDEALPPYCLLEEGGNYTSAELKAQQRTDPRSSKRTMDEQEQMNSRLTSQQQQSPPEFQEAWNQMKEAFNTLQNICSKSKEKLQEEDECDLYGKMLAKKLRKLPEEEREIVMYEIDGIFYNRRLNRDIQNSTSSS